MNALMMIMMVWIGATADLPIPEELPDVKFRTAEWFRTTYAEHPRTTIGGTYDDENMIVNLRDNWTAFDLVDLSILAHELTHHMQYSAGIVYPCSGAMEEVAYGVQRRFLALAGIDMFESYLSMTRYIQQTSCMPHHMAAGR